MAHYKVEKWVQLNENHKRQYIFAVKDMKELNKYWDGKGCISTHATIISNTKYVIMKIFYNCYKKEFLQDQKSIDK